MLRPPFRRRPSASALLARLRIAPGRRRPRRGWPLEALRRWRPARSTVPALDVRARVRPILWSLGLVALGAAAMYIFDPRLGRRRRALARDKAVKAYYFLTRRAPERLEHRARYVAGRLHGLEHEVAHEVSHLLRPEAEVEPDNVTLVQRVRSEIFAPADIPDGAINVDAYEGVITLRGELPSQELIDRVVRMARHVEGVREVRNLLHTPGTPVPPH